MRVNLRIVCIVFFFSITSTTFAQTERWVYRYPHSGGDEAYCLVYGADGNLYAGGHTWGTNTSQFTVISLTNSGAERWVYRQRDGIAFSICNAGDGNIYAVGVSLDRLTVISLTPDGNERWVYQYSDTSCGREICYGNDGNIYVVGDDHQRKIVVIALDTTGRELWNYVYRTPSSESEPAGSITYGLDGNIYVVGEAGPVANTDITVISLTPSGSERWVYLYDGTNYYDFGNCIVAGPDSNIYVFGSTCDYVPPGYTYWCGVVISLSNTGNGHWTYFSHGYRTWYNKGIYGGDGNLYMAGDFGWDIPFLLVESISDSGSYRWEYIDTTVGTARSLVYGDDGNIYVAGLSSDYYLPDTTGHFTVLKFAPDGSIIWVYRYPKSDDAYLFGAYSVIYGTDGNIYAAGATPDSLTGEDFTVISLSSTGIQEARSTKVNIKLKVRPNVIRNDAKLEYTVSEKEHIGLDLYDILGRKVATITEGIFEPGLYTYNLNASNLASGIYFLILQCKEGRKSQKIIVAR
ncbi:MAG: T9SS type A sorting domain-containing protein [bacterium]